MEPRVLIEFESKMASAINVIFMADLIREIPSNFFK